MLGIGLSDQEASARVALALKIEVVAFMVLATGGSLHAEERFILMVEAVQLVAVRVAIIAGLGAARIADDARQALILLGHGPAHLQICSFFHVRVELSITSSMRRWKESDDGPCAAV